MHKCTYCERRIPLGDSVVKFQLDSVNKMVLQTPNVKMLFFHRSCFGRWYEEVYQVKMIALASDVFIGAY